jgi:hypothetical protein
MNTAAVALSLTGTTGLIISGVLNLSWSGSLFFAILENYIPSTSTMLKIKMVVTELNYEVALPIQFVEWISNQILGFVENLATR